MSTILLVSKQYVNNTTQIDAKLATTSNTVDCQELNRNRQILFVKKNIFLTVSNPLAVLN